MCVGEEWRHCKLTGDNRGSLRGVVNYQIEVAKVVRLRKRLISLMGRKIVWRRRGEREANSGEILWKEMIRDDQK